ncbi:TIGR01620 family protein [Octadecabacter sp. 1_MG-2023]|uniref:YcjF family protein n=1 Tax=unclassified Octadecabacter TaxID=196158 RepID=UPI001C084810|nr:MULTISPECIES: TIGR01620 family protein [unclassified Octadecabacter]MBU2994643.1 YcjF family protein [Octadecabacter sp. B2R22]MDO6734064.1 TIGR01620 family protein [Octadecabacter sp. 1_MG-2023]
MTETSKSGPVLFDLDEPNTTSPADAPAVPDVDLPPTPAAMQRVASLAAARPNRLARWFWGLLVSLVGFFVGVAAWDFVMGLLDRSPVLGWIAVGLTGLFCGVLLLIAVREFAAFARLRRVDRIQTGAAGALADGNLTRARSVTGQITALYRNRDDTSWGREEFNSKQADILDADGLLGLAESTILAPLDARARLEVEAAARQVATVTAIVPLALADVFTALTSNMRMIRRIAEIYEGRAGTLGTWRLTKQVLTHLVATGAVAVGDDLIGSVAGGGVLSKVSRRFGEGVINGALTARVGVAAMEVCRPLPFNTERRPSVTSLVKRSLTGLFGLGSKDG